MPLFLAQKFETKPDNDVHLLSTIRDNNGNRADFIRTDRLLTKTRHSDSYILTLDWQHQRLTTTVTAF
ncbi:hypothetical protein HMPREF0454_01645 [Hafnia alvei ATCC 51873]|uniref:Uncharacterized protein n=1 Tax=Hafnia alvei ATCC 51873 TaxID=1002364 RepID=G9Y507_HAFAL|nr:hypothetical protein HMPREF0454_01645 [Hafnia alvei ATCC 51873]